MDDWCDIISYNLVFKRVVQLVYKLIMYLRGVMDLEHVGCRRHQEDPVFLHVLRLGYNEAKVDSLGLNVAGARYGIGLQEGNA